MIYYIIIYVVFFVIIIRNTIWKFYFLYLTLQNKRKPFIYLIKVQDNNFLVDNKIVMLFTFNKVSNRKYLYNLNNIDFIIKYLYLKYSFFVLLGTYLLY